MDLNEQDSDSSILKKIYYNPKTGFSSALELYTRARKQRNTIKLPFVKEWLSKQETQQIHRKPIRRKAQQFSIEAKRGTWQADFTFTKNRKINNGFHCIFVAIEIGSRFAFCMATKNTKAKATRDCFRKLRKVAKQRGLGLNYVVSDKGSEFISHDLADWMTRNGVNHRTVHPQYHYYATSIVERFNGTLKSKLNRYMTANKTKKWVDALQDLVEAYNSSNHTHFQGDDTPDSVSNDPVKQLLHRLKTIGKNNALRASPKFILNKVDTGSKIRVREKINEKFRKLNNTYSNKVRTIESIEKGGTMVRVSGVDRLLRPFELQKVEGKVQKNPFKRKIKSVDVETNLENARTAQQQPKPPVEAEKEKFIIGESDVGKMYFNVEENGERFTGKLVGIQNTEKPYRIQWDSGTYSDVRKKDIVRWKRDFPNPSRTEISSFELKLSSKSKPKTKPTKEKTGVNEKTRAKIDVINSNPILAIRGDTDQPYWLCKRLSNVRRAVIADEKSSDEIKRGDHVVGIQWYDLVSGRKYKLLNYKQLVKVESCFNADKVRFAKIDKRNNEYLISEETHKNIMSARK